MTCPSWPQLFSVCSLTRRATPPADSDRENALQLNDTDTVAVIAGALLGARWGASLVPPDWRHLVHGIGARRAADLERLARGTAASGSVG